MPDGKKIPPGAEVPGAADWRNIHTWVSARHLRPAHYGELEAAEAAPISRPAPVVETVDAEDVGSPPDAMPKDPAGTLADMLAAVMDNPDKYSKADMADAAKAAGIEVPDPLPRRKAALVTALAEAAGISL